jgi:hypothetical protein
VRKIKPILPFIILITLLYGMVSVNAIINDKHIVPLEFVVNHKANTKPVNIYGITHKNIITSTNITYYFKEYIIVGDTASINTIQVKKNGVTLETITSKQFTERLVDDLQYDENFFSKDSSHKCYTINFSGQSLRSKLPYFKQFLNWAGDWNLVKRILFNPLIVAICIIAFLYFLYKKTRQNIFLENPIVIKEFKSTSVLWALFILLFAILMYLDQYYFLQDDNYAQFTPVIVHGLDGLYTNGTFPTYNPYQYGGMPTLDQSIYALLYPLTHISFLVAKYVFGDSYYFNNVFAGIHFAIGYYFLYKLLRKFNIHFWIATTAALSFIFCGYNLMAVRSWYYVAPTIAFLPLLLYLRYIMVDKVFKLKHYCRAIVLLAFYAYSGNFQYWLYTIGVLLLVEIYINNKKWRVAFLHSTIILAGAMLLFLPQLLSTYHAVKDIAREGGAGDGIIKGLHGMFIPFVFKEGMPNGWGGVAYKSYSNLFYQGGYLFTFSLFCFLIIGVLKKFKLGQHFAFTTWFKVLLFLFIITLLLSMGKSGILWTLQSKLPILNKFNHPFKFFLFVQFFGITCGAIIISVLLPLLKQKYALTIFTILSLASLVYQVVMTKDAFYMYNYKKPYKELPYQQVLSHVDNNYRILPLSVIRSNQIDFAHTLVLNFPTPYKINSVVGLEVLYNSPFDFFKNHRQVGIRYVISSKLKSETGYFNEHKGFENKLTFFNSMKKVYETDQTIIWEDTAYEKLVQLFDINHQLINQSIQIDNRNNGIAVSFTKPTGVVSKIILGYNYQDNLHVFINGQKVTKDRDSIGRVIVYPNVEVKQIQTKYIPHPFLKKIIF